MNLLTKLQFLTWYQLTRHNKFRDDHGHCLQKFNQLCENRLKSNEVINLNSQNDDYDEAIFGNSLTVTRRGKF